MTTRTLARVLVTGMIGIAVGALIRAKKRRTPAVLVEQTHGARNDQSRLDTWENEGGNAA
jgi:hypothetical protein